ncbi:MAG: PfkB family carbohydrate kinase [Marinirhabdus sp.]
MHKIVTFGEIMLRLSTQRFLRFSQAQSFNINYGGGEYNVAVSLSNFGLNTEFITRLPNNEIGRSALMEINKRNVGSSFITFGGDRLGIYFFETGAGTRGSNVVYDRSNSAMATLRPGGFNWKDILKGATWFHWSGITPAVSQHAAEECLEAVKTANELGILISSDLNYRSKLWKYGKTPAQVMPGLLQYSNIILGDIDTALFMLGKSKVAPNYSNLKSLPALYDQIFEHCPNLQTIATTLRYSVSASHQRIGGMLYNGQELFNANIKEVTPVVDRVGSGDAFMAGLIYGLINSTNYQYALDFAVASCCLKHTIYGDCNLVTKEEIEKYLSGENDGSVQR